jgi:hypothetical protein
MKFYAERQDGTVSTLHADTFHQLCEGLECIHEGPLEWDAHQDGPTEFYDPENGEVVFTVEEDF